MTQSSENAVVEDHPMFKNDAGENLYRCSPDEHEEGLVWMNVDVPTSKEIGKDDTNAYLRIVEGDNAIHLTRNQVLFLSVRLARVVESELDGHLEGAATVDDVAGL